MDLHPKQLVRVNVESIQGEGGFEKIVDRHFSVDPRTITLKRLRHLVARALDVRGEFSLVWLKSGLPLTCDWDLEGALSEEPRIELILQMQPKEPGLEEWDIICPADVPVAGHEASPTPCPRKSSFLEQVLHLCSPHPQGTSRVPLTQSEFSSLADWSRPLRYAVYRAGGAEPSVRPALWLHLLDVYPAGVNHIEREEFLNRKSEEYYDLRHSWQKLVQIGSIPEVVRDITCLVRKDVRRTDRTQLQDSDQRALYNVLTTYALHHPSIGYRQGMSDLLSPLMHVLRTEARAYVALCGLMLRMRDNFRSWRSLRTKFRHLRRVLRAHDPALHRHLKMVGAIDLLFCYRWLLLDLKREFPYHEMLTLTEMMWATLRPVHRDKGVELYEMRFPAVKGFVSDLHLQTSTVKDESKRSTEVLGSEEEDFGPSEGARRTNQRCATKRRASRRQSSVTQDVESEGSSSSSSDTDDHMEKVGDVFRHRRRRLRSRNDSRDHLERSRSLDLLNIERRECTRSDSDTIFEVHDCRSTATSGRRLCHSHSLDNGHIVNGQQTYNSRAFGNECRQQEPPPNNKHLIDQTPCRLDSLDRNHDIAEQPHHWHSLDDGHEQQSCHPNVMRNNRGQQQLSIDHAIGRQPCYSHTSDNGRALAEEPRLWSGKDYSSDNAHGPCHNNNAVHEVAEAWSENDSTDHRRRHGSSDSNYGSTLSDFDEGTTSSHGSRQSSSEGYDSHRTLTEHESSSDDDGSNCFPFDSVDLSYGNRNHDHQREEGHELLPPPTRLGDGKPFLIFLCLVMLQSQREAVLGRQMDCSEIGIHFDRMSRKHRLADILPRAQEMFEEYLRNGWTEDD